MKKTIFYLFYCLFSNTANTATAAATITTTTISISSSSIRIRLQTPYNKFEQTIAEFSKEIVNDIKRKGERERERNWVIEFRLQTFLLIIKIFVFIHSNNSSTIL